MVQVNDITKKLYEATVKLAMRRNAESRRHVPSPSSVEYCTRRNWFVETGVPATEEPDPEAFIAAESGRMTESLFSAIINESGIGRVEPLTEEERELLPVQYKPLFLRGGQFDQMVMMRSNDEKVDGDVVLAEFKRKAVYDILSLHRLGLLEALPGEYQQVQTLLKALKLNRCLYFAINWDRSALTKAQQGATRKGEARLPGMYAEWIKANPLAVAAVVQRAQMQSKYILTEKDVRRVPRDYDPTLPEKKRDWQCTWCPWLSACLNAEGIQHKPGRVGQKKSAA